MATARHAITPKNSMYTSVHHPLFHQFMFPNRVGSAVAGLPPNFLDYHEYRSLIGGARLYPG